MDIIGVFNNNYYCCISGLTQGTTYRIIYSNIECLDLTEDISILLCEFENSLSVYKPNSLISRINRNESVKTDCFFDSVFFRAKEIYKLTDGKFDIASDTIYKAWGVNIGKKNLVSESEVLRLKQLSGMDKVELVDGKIIKSNPNILLNMNAIAKGYSADLIANLLDNHLCQDYMVEVGGELRLKGVNLDGNFWRVGIEQPSELELVSDQKIEAVLSISDKGIATSGNYKQFYIENGRKVTHIIDPTTGFPLVSDLLSVTVIAEDTMTADALATAFMIAGIDQSMDWIEQDKTIDAIFITEEQGQYQVHYTEGLEGCLWRP